MKLLSLVFKVLFFILLTLESLIYFSLNRLEKSLNYLGKLIVLFLPVIVYNILDNLYHITPRLVIEIMGLFELCLSLLS